MFSCSALCQTNLSTSAVGPGVTSQPIDLLPGADDLSLGDVASSSSSDRLEAAVGLQRLQPGHQGSLSIASSGMMPPHCAPCSQASSPSRSRFVDVSDVDGESSTIIANLRRTLRSIDHQSQQREVDLVRIVATLLETPRPLLDASTRQFIQQTTSLADLVVLAIGDAVVPLDQTYSVARLCVALAQSERSRAALRQRMEAAITESMDLRAQLKTSQVEAATWQAVALRTTGVIESLKKSIFTLETEGARVSAQRVDRLDSADRIVSSLQLAIQARDREISHLTG